MSRPAMPPKRKRGFTLVEMLCTIVTLLLVAMLMTTGVKFAANAFTKTLASSHARVLCTNLQTIVSDELRFTTSVKLDAEEEVKQFYSVAKGKETNFSTDAQGYVSLADEPLLSANAYPYGLRADVQVDAYDRQNRVFTVTIRVHNSDRSTELACVTFDVRALSDVTVLTE